MISEEIWTAFPSDHLLTQRNGDDLTKCVWGQAVEAVAGKEMGTLLKEYLAP